MKPDGNTTYSHFTLTFDMFQPPSWFLHNLTELLFFFVIRCGRIGLCMWCCPVCPGSGRSSTRRRTWRWTDFSAKSKATSSENVSILTGYFMCCRHSSVCLMPNVLFQRRRVKTHVPMLQVWTADKPHQQEEVRDGCTNCMK